MGTHKPNVKHDIIQQKNYSIHNLSIMLAFKKLPTNTSF